MQVSTLTMAVLATSALLSTAAHGQAWTEDFEGVFPGSWVPVTGVHVIDPAAAYTGVNGARSTGSWMYNLTPNVQEGDIVSIWTRARLGNYRTYMGFDASAAGCKSFVFSANTMDIRFQTNNGYGYTELTTAPFVPTPNTWYLMECELMPGGLAEGRIYDTGGVLLAMVQHNYGTFTGGGVALRSGFSSGHDSDDMNVMTSGSPSCVPSAPAPAATVSADVDLVFDVDDPQMDPLTMFFEFSSDAGMTWGPMTATVGSLLANPTLGQPSPALGLTFTWDSLVDIPVVGMPVPVEMRITVDDGVLNSNCSVSVDVIPPPPSCTIQQPAAPIRGIYPVSVDAVSTVAPTVDVVIEFSIDGGISWAPATPGPADANPWLGAPTGMVIWEWDTVSDSVALMAPEILCQLRLTVDDGGPFLGNCQTTNFTVDNAGCALCGDCDLNGIAPNIIDALTAAQIAVALFLPTPEQDLCCDVDDNGSITVVDALLMAQAAAGLPIMLVCP